MFGGPVEYVGVPKHEHLRPWSAVGKLALAAQALDRRVPRPLPEAVLLRCFRAHLVRRDQPSKERQRVRQVFVLCEQIEKSVEEALEDLGFKPSLQERDHRLLGPQRNQPVRIHPHVAPGAVLAEKGKYRVMNTRGHRFAGTARLGVACVKFVAVHHHHCLAVEAPLDTHE